MAKKKKKKKVEKVIKVVVKEKHHRHHDDCHCKSLCRRFRCRPVCHLRRRCGCRHDFFDHRHDFFDHHHC